MESPTHKHDVDQLLKYEPILDNWYGPGFTEKQIAYAGHYKPIGEILQQVLNEIKLEQKTKTISILKIWNSIVDPTVALHAQPTNLKDGTLYIHVDSSTWLNELAVYRSAELLEILQNALGRDTVKKLKFYTG